MASLNLMVQRVCGLTSNDLSDWEDNFLESISEKTDNGKNTTMLTEKQIDVITRIFDKHFAG